MSAGDLGVWAKPTLVGERVTLRPYASEGEQAKRDIAAVWDMIHDAEGNDLTATTASFERRQIDQWVRSRAAAPERLDLVIVDNATGEVAGEVVLNEPVFRDQQGADARVAVAANYRIALRGSAWYGRGLGTEAGQLLLAHARESMRLEQLTLEVLGRNPRAVRSYDKLGFVEAGRSWEDGDEWIQMTVRLAEVKREGS